MAKVPTNARKQPTPTTPIPQTTQPVQVDISRFKRIEKGEE